MNKALGLIETIGLIAAIEAADAAVKAANVTLVGYENTKGGGKITVKLVGDVGAVQAAVASGRAAASRVGKVYGSLVISRPHEEIDRLIQQVDRGKPASSSPGKQKKTTKTARAEVPETPVAIQVVVPPPMETPQPTPGIEPGEETSQDTSAVSSEPVRCIAVTKAGAPCKLPARPGSDYCIFHRKLEKK